MKNHSSIFSQKSFFSSSRFFTALLAIFAMFTNPFFNLKFFSIYFSLLFFLPTTISISFHKTRFDSIDTTIVYEGGATPNLDGTIEFNDVNYMCQTGWITYGEKVPIWDPKTQQLTDFTTQFSFFFDIQGRNQWGSGLAFFMAPVGSHLPLNSAGGFLGLFNTSDISSRNKMVHVEFDTYWNREWEPSYLHVGINNNSIQSAAYALWNAKNHTGDPADVLINYDSKTKNLSVSWEYHTTSVPGENTSVSLIIDLMQVLPEYVIIGFSASTSNRIERHVLQSWKFDSNLVIHEKKKTDPKMTRLILAASVTVGGTIIVGITIVFLMKLEKKRTETMKLKSINVEFEREAGPRKYSYKELVSATNNFSEKNELGRGGFGAVYKGYLKHSGIVIAVKKMSRGSKQGRKDYMDEVKLISQLRHRNLVRLLGWCHDGGEFLLVYEYMSNGSLDSHLFKKKIPLTWAARYRIANGLASALLYLHEGWEKCVLHRDIKPSNIMVDKNVNVKLGDFGLARFTDHKLGKENMGLAGTPGYMAPEYIKSGSASKEADVYSFGLVALEIATGKKAVEQIVENDQVFTLRKWVWDLYGSGKLRNGVDVILEKDFDEKDAIEAECLMIVGLWCAHPEPERRPSISQVIHVLKFEAALPNLPREMPIDAANEAVENPNAFTCGDAVISYTNILEVGR
ncbi:Concanavalin A-like lectin protein kinase family protein [Euphorbia peplus]|nr:Concanavalin A-like lectin protein kinase family protein [Euphorbia peplus]